MNEEYSRFGIYVGKDGMLASSMCHAQPEHAGRGECQHFSFADTAEEAQRKLNYYLTERINGRISSNQVDGTAGDYLSALRNWLVLEKGYSKESLPYPDGSSILDAWFHGDEQLYRKIIDEAKKTSLLASLNIGDDEKEQMKALVEADIPINILSDPSLHDDDHERIAMDTAAWLSINGISEDAASMEQDMENSSVNVISTGDSRADIHEIEHLDKRYITSSGNHDHDEAALNERYLQHQR